MAEDLKNYGPVSLMSILYKILIEYLGTRMKKFMGDSVSDLQIWGTKDVQNFYVKHNEFGRFKERRIK